MGVFGSLLGGILGGAAGSALAGGEDPALQKAALSRKAQLALDAQKKAAEQSPEAIAAEQMAGAKEAGLGQVPQEALIKRSQQQLGGAVPADYAKALRQRSEKSYGSDVAKLANKSKIAAVGQKFENERRYQQSQMTQNQLEQSYQQAMLDHEAEMERGRNAVIANLIGGAGTMAGYGLASMGGAKASPSPAPSATPMTDSGFNMPQMGSQFRSAGKYGLGE